MKQPFQILLYCSLIGLASLASAQNHNSIPIIFDTDFAMPPTDDALALMLALQSPELNILGITTVAGHSSLERATSDVLRMLEIAERIDIPVYEGADLPLVHRISNFAVNKYGSWYSDAPPPEPYGGYAKKKIENQSAAVYIEKKVLANPGEITIVALGPLTNIAQAIQNNPDFAKKVKRLFIMGGAIASLPDGSGNITPNAEYNFWVDPEAARITLRSGIPIELSPLNVSRKSALTRDWYEKMVAVKTPLTDLLKIGLGPRFKEDPDRVWLMYDQITIASLIDPSLVVSKKMYVDVNDNHDISYGVSIAGSEVWPGAEGAQKMNVQYDLDWPRFMQLFIKRLQQPLND